MKVYDQIAKEFSATRIHPWPLVKGYIGSLPSNTCLLDVGCGNGKNQFRKDLTHVSVDSSIEMCRFVEGAVQCCATSLPFRTGSIDNCISIACVHHLDTFEKRRSAISEIYRVLKPEGTALLTFWEAQPKYGKHDTMIKWRTEEHMRYYYLSTKECIHDLFAGYDCRVETSFHNFYVTLRKPACQYPTRGSCST